MVYTPRKGWATFVQIFVLSAQAGGRQMKFKKSGGKSSLKGRDPCPTPPYMGMGSLSKKRVFNAWGWNYSFQLFLEKNARGTIMLNFIFGLFGSALSFIISIICFTWYLEIIKWSNDYEIIIAKVG